MLKNDILEAKAKIYKNKIRYNVAYQMAIQVDLNNDI